MKTAANCESQCKMHYLLNRSSTCRTHMAAHYVGHACPRVGYTSARARTVQTERRRAAVYRWRPNPPPHPTAPRCGAIRGPHRAGTSRGPVRRPFGEPPQSGRVVHATTGPSGPRARARHGVRAPRQVPRDRTDRTRNTESESAPRHTRVGPAAGSPSLKPPEPGQSRGGTVGTGREGRGARDSPGRSPRARQAPLPLNHSDLGSGETTR